MKLWLYAWSNDGTRYECGLYLSEKDALKAAKVFRRLEYRTVKLADHGGSIYHWARVPLKSQPNKWVRRAVSDEIFT